MKGMIGSLLLLLKTRASLSTTSPRAISRASSSLPPITAAISTACWPASRWTSRTSIRGRRETVSPDSSAGLARGRLGTRTQFVRAAKGDLIPFGDVAEDLDAVADRHPLPHVHPFHRPAP